MQAYIKLGKSIRSTLGRFEFDVLVETIKNAREEAKVSQRAVARGMGCNEGIYGKIERGERIIDVVEFVDAARSMGADPLELFGRYLIAVQQSKVNRETKSRKKPE